MGKEFVITRDFDAPRELVFRAWTEAGHLARWWGPRGFTNPACDWVAQPGKAIYVVMRAPNGTDYPMGGEFREITAPERLVFTSGALDEDGKLLFEFLHTVKFSERNGGTRLTIESRVIKTTPDAGKYIGGFDAGMTQSLERLAGHLEAKGEPVVIERMFKAPAALVWRALTDKDELKRWYFDLKEFRAEAGFEFQFSVEHEGFTYDHRCRITEVIPEKKLVHTWRYEGHAGDSLVTIELVADGSWTRLRLTHEGLESFPKLPAFARKNFLAGWTEIIGSSLVKFLEGDTAGREIVISRVFDAPRELVWEAMTNPRHVVHWWGPRGFSTTTEQMDVRPGGVWKHVMHGPDGANYPNKSIFREVVKPERIVYSHGGGREQGPGASFTATWTFEEVAAGQTKLTGRMLFSSPAERDLVVREFGAIEGGKQTLERLAEYLPKMQSAAGSKTS